MKHTLEIHRSVAQRGLSLIEVLVGVAIGIIGVLAIFQTVAVWNRHMLTSTAGGDAQVSGALALFDLERDLKQSGHGFGNAPAPVMGCDVQAFDTTGRGAFNFTLAPISIVVGAGGAPDQVNVLYGSSSFFTEAQSFLFSTPTSKTLLRRGGFKMGDLVLVADAGGAAPGSANCSLAEITADTNLDLATVDHANAPYTSFYTGPGAVPRFNPPGGLAFAYGAGNLYNLGPVPQLITWQIANNRGLQRGEAIFNPAPVSVADGVINLKAQFGVDSDISTRIEPGEWVAALPIGTNWTQVLAIRVAVLVRSRQFEKSNDAGSGAPIAVTTAAPTYFGGAFVMTNVDGTGDAFGGAPNTPDPNNWRFYRYRVYERVIPLRNVLWPL